MLPWRVKATFSHEKNKLFVSTVPRCMWKKRKTKGGTRRLVRHSSKPNRSLKGRAASQQNSFFCQHRLTKKKKMVGPYRKSAEINFAWLISYKLKSSTYTGGTAVVGTSITTTSLFFPRPRQTKGRQKKVYRHTLAAIIADSAPGGIQNLTFQLFNPSGAQQRENDVMITGVRAPCSAVQK